MSFYLTLLYLALRGTTLPGSNARDNTLGRDVYVEGGIHKRDRAGGTQVVAIDVDVELTYDAVRDQWQYVLGFPAEMNDFFLKAKFVNYADDKYVGTSATYSSAQSARLTADTQAKNVVARYNKYLKACREPTKHKVRVDLGEI